MRDDGGDVENGRAPEQAEQRQREMAGKIGNAALSAMMRSNSAMVVSSKERESAIPALLTRISSPAKRSLRLQSNPPDRRRQKVAGEQQRFYAVFPDRSGRRRELFLLLQSSASEMPSCAKRRAMQEPIRRWRR